MPASTRRATSIYGAPVVAKRPSGGSVKPKPATTAQPRAWDDSTTSRDRVSDGTTRRTGDESRAANVSARDAAAKRRLSASSYGHSVATRPLGASNATSATFLPASSSKKPSKPSAKKPNPKTHLTKGEYGKLIGVGPTQRRANRVDVDLALLKKDDPSRNYDAFADVEAGFRPGSESLGAPRGGDADTDGLETEIEGDGMLEPSRRANVPYAPSIRFSKNPKYRTVTSGGVFVAPPDMSGEPPAPGSAADRAAHPPKPPRSTGDERLDRQRLKAKLERERRVAETLASKKAALKARREASAAEASVGLAELTFFKDTVRRMAEKYNALKAATDAKAAELGKLVTDFADRDTKQNLQVRDKNALRGGGGALFGKPVSRSANGAVPKADLKLEELRARVADAERNAEAERLRTATLGHMILRLRESDPTTEARRADPHASLATTRETAVAASASAESSVPWVGRKLELVKRYQEDVNAAIEAERARAYTAANEESQARAMLARTIFSINERREAYEAQLGQRRMTLVAMRAEDEAMAARKESFINRLAQMNKELAEEERDRKRGGKAALPGFSGGLARAFITAMTGGALRTQEAKTDAAIRKLVAVIPDVTPEGLIEGFKNRKQRKTLTRETSRARQQEHDALLRRRNELVEELARTKEELYNADESLDEDAATRARFLRRPEDRVDDGVFMAEHATRATRLTLGDKEKELGNIATGVLNLSDAVRRFDETLERTLRGWAAAVDDARDAIAARDAIGRDAAATPGTRGDDDDDPSRARISARVATNDANGDGDVSTAGAVKNEPETEETEETREENEPTLSDEKDAARKTDLMNATARECIAYLETFYDALERANVVALADLHRERTFAAAREQGVHPSKVIVSSLELEQDLTRPAVPALSALRRDSFRRFGGGNGTHGSGTDLSQTSSDGKPKPKREGSSKSVTLLLFDENERFEVDSVHDDVHDAGFGSGAGSDAEPEADPSSPGSNPFGGGLQRRDSMRAKIGSGTARIVRQFSSHNLRVDVKAGSEEEEEEEEEEEGDDDGDDDASPRDPRLSQKAASVVVFRKGLKKGESASWARETEARMERPKMSVAGPRSARSARPSLKRQASSEGEAEVFGENGDDDAPDAAAE